MIATIEEVKTRLSITGSGDDAVLTQVVEEIDQAIKTYLDRNIERLVYDEYVDTSGGLNREKYFTKDFPIEAGSVTITNNGTEWVEGTNYDVDYVNGIIFFHTLPSIGFKKLRVQYSAGYESTDIPKDLKMAVINASCTLFNNRKQTGVKSESLGDYSVTYGDTNSTDSLLDSVSNILDKYRRYV